MRIRTSWKGERKFEVIGTGMLPLQTKKHLNKKIGDEEDVSENLSHKHDDQKRYPGKLEPLNIVDGQEGNTPAIVTQGVKMEQGDPEKNHQPSAAFIKQKKNKKES
jgi:hypothetical protein